MTNPELDKQAPGYVSEYRQAFVPLTQMDRDSGVITDATTGNRVELPATDPDYRQRYGGFATAQAIHHSFNSGRERQLTEALERELGYLVPPSMVIE
ncbi:MAG: hypothetical protein JWN82_555 [Candidatus Saccharibacteria bacterium]|nr:hypothetical protein [Candidatus Saccharibacteria bacterium]